MNNITFDGRLAADAELRYTAGGDAVLSFRVASDIGFGDKKTTNWFQCQVWGKRGETLQQYLQKGQQVTVYGQLTLREWHDKEGAKKLSPDVRVNEISLQGGKREEASEQKAPPPPGARQKHAEEMARRKPADDGLDDDVFF